MIEWTLSQINASFLINASLTLLCLYQMLLSNTINTTSCLTDSPDTGTRKKQKDANSFNLVSFLLD